MKHFFKFFLLSISFGFSWAAISIDSTEAVCGNGYGYTPCEIKAFLDTKNHSYRDAIEYVQVNGIVKGYDDGTYKPDNTINRAEFTKILIEAILGQTPTEPPAGCFPDIERGMWFEKYVCYAKRENILSGYPNGTFQAGNNINFAEAAKILVKSFGIPHEAPKENQLWYAGFFTALEQQKNIPTSIKKADHLLTRGEMAEMIMRIKLETTSKPSLSACDLILQLCSGEALQGYGDETLPNIDMPTVRAAWLGWYNDARAELGLHPYSYNNALNRTAFLWSEFSKNRGSITHKRIGQTTYYDYQLILKWFQDLGVDFVNVQRVTFSENIGGGIVSCNDADCTQEMIDGIRSTFDFYMGEKNKADRPHYNSVMNKYFNEIGLGIVLDGKRYYLTVHYGTQLK